MPKSIPITPHAEGHEGLGPLASRFVKPDDLAWRETRFAGVSVKTLLLDKSTGLLTVMVKMAPGAKLPDHEHVLIEQTYMLEGRLVDEEGECGPGEYVWRPAGSRHEAWTPEGGLMIAMFQAPNKFFEETGEITDMLGQDWEAAWGGTLDKSA